MIQKHHSDSIDKCHINKFSKVPSRDTKPKSSMVPKASPSSSSTPSANAVTKPKFPTFTWESLKKYKIFS